LSEFERLINPKTKAILICNPGNPTGCLYRKDELEVLASIVEKHNLWLFSDEVYREFVYDGNHHYSVLSFPEISENSLVVDSVSKRFNLCGVRVGCVVTKNRDLYQTILKFAQSRLSPPSIGQYVAEAALNVESSYFEVVRSEYEKRRNFIVDRLNKIPGVICPKPGGAFYAMVQLPVKDSEDFCRFLLSDFSFNNSTVMLAPASGFYATPQKGQNQVRLAYVLNINDLSKAADCLEAGLEAYKSRN